jgi:hypothetical protein
MTTGARNDDIGSCRFVNLNVVMYVDVFIIIIIIIIMFKKGG